MILSKHLITGNYVLYIDPETDIEARHLRNFAQRNEKLTAEIRFDNVAATPRLTIRKDITKCQKPYKP